MLCNKHGTTICGCSEDKLRPDYPLEQQELNSLLQKKSGTVINNQFINITSKNQKQVIQTHSENRIQNTQTTTTTLLNGNHNRNININPQKKRNRDYEEGECTSFEEEEDEMSTDYLNTSSTSEIQNYFDEELSDTVPNCFDEQYESNTKELKTSKITNINEDLDDHSFINLEENSEFISIAPVVSSTSSITFQQAREYNKELSKTKNFDNVHFLL